MPLVPAFSATQSLGYNDLITFTDDSTGADATITERRIYVQLANGNYLTTAGESTVEVYTLWDYADLTTQLSLLSEATAPSIRVDWLAGSTVVYTVTTTFDFNLQDYIYAYGLLQYQTSNPRIIQDKDYYFNFIQFIVNLFNSENAITIGGDIFSAQGALDRNQFMMQEEQLYF